MMDDRALRNLNRFNLGVFAALFVLFWANVLLGKAKISFGWQIPFLLGDVAEYLLLLFTALFFILAALGQEKLVSRNQGAANPASGRADN